jgi:predicted kinase
MKKKLILVAAPPACGKTYVSELISRSVEHIVYLDKDDLAAIIRCAFELCGEELNMDGQFYAKNLRPSEYSTILNIAFSTLRFSDLVLLNAPLSKEVRDSDYMRSLKERAASLGAELVLIWVTAPTEVCYERMKKRNSDRDTLKLQNWDKYVKNIDYSAPAKLLEDKAVDSLIVFDTADDNAFADSLEKTLEIIRK